MLFLLFVLPQFIFSYTYFHLVGPTLFPIISPRVLITLTTSEFRFLLTSSSFMRSKLNGKRINVTHYLHNTRNWNQSSESFARHSAAFFCPFHCFSREIPSLSTPNERTINAVVFIFFSSRLSFSQ